MTGLVFIFMARHCQIRSFDLCIFYFGERLAGFASPDTAGMHLACRVCLACVGLHSFGERLSLATVFRTMRLVLISYWP
jgi:hypothetical protein